MGADPPVRILLHDYAGHAFPLQLSRRLAGRGHKVHHVYAGYNVTPRGYLDRKDSDAETLEIRPIYLQEPLDKSNLIRRWLQERQYGRLAAREIEAAQPDVVVCANTPLDALRSIARSSDNIDALFIIWLQDLIGVATEKILAKRIPLVGHAVGRYYRSLEARLLRSSDRVVAISEDFISPLADMGVDLSEVVVIENWAPLEELPQLPKANPWAEERGLTPTFRFAYTGTLGMKHNPELLLKLADAIDAHESGAELLVTSEGAGADWLRQELKRRDVENLTLFGFQPMDRYAEVLAAADVLVAVLERHAGVYSVPSKVLSYLCAGRPLLLAVPRDNLAATIVEENEAGIVVEPDDEPGFIRGALTLMADPELRADMGRNARDYAEKTFDIEAITDRFERVLMTTCQSERTPSPLNSRR